MECFFSLQVCRSSISAAPCLSPHLPNYVHVRTPSQPVQNCQAVILPLVLQVLFELPLMCERKFIISIFQQQEAALTTKVIFRQVLQILLENEVVPNKGTSCGHNAVGEYLLVLGCRQDIEEAPLYVVEPQRSFNMPHSW